ncbi:thioredoxin family protein [uncultured Flavobacterium sp.]|uniref:thioredoxin family protein n=1 Tax=uncultured Flavobacterium sp. TaxID=165435 RepID=UPI0025F2DD77|nr:thioredoxin family protein [uncultured Flavobacterium sp.]
MKTFFMLLSLAMAPAAFSQDWKNFEEAKTLAAKENKNIILVFSGSDWCAPCIKLDKSIWQSEDFKSEAKKEWILVKADFPKKKGHELPLALQEQNKALAEKYNKDGFFPLVVVLDKNGKASGKTAFKNITPKEYIALLHSLEKK